MICPPFGFCLSLLVWMCAAAEYLERTYSSTTGDTSNIRCKTVLGTNGNGLISCGTTCLKEIQELCHVFGVDGDDCAMCSRCDNDDADGYHLQAMAPRPFTTMYQYGRYSYI